MSAFLELRGIEKRFTARGADTLVLAGLDLAVERNEFVSIVGPSGCGKSTLLNIVAGLVEPTAGTALLDGVPLGGPGPDRGVVFQQYALLPWMTVRENLRFALEASARAGKPANAEKRIDAMLETVGLAHAARRYPRELSGGMKQRVGFARALLIEPKMLLLDEPFGALDALTRASLQDEVLALWKTRPMTALMITHDIEEALLLSDRVLIMSRGPAARFTRFVESGFPRPRSRADVTETAEFAHLSTELLAHLTHESHLAEESALAAR